MSDQSDTLSDPVIDPSVTPLQPKTKKIQFPELAEKPYWGKREPDSEHWYTDADGIQLFVVGRFTHPKSKREDFVTSFFNGEEWVKKVPATWDSVRPLYNMIQLWNEEQSFQNCDVVIVQDEWKAMRLEDFFRENEMPYIATTWNGGMKGIRKTMWEQGLRHRNVILWPCADDFSSDMFDLVKGCISPFVERLSEVDRLGNNGFSCLDAINNAISFENGWSIQKIREFLHSATDVPLVTPGTEVNEQGIGHLETFIPLGFIEKMKEDFGVFGKDGRKVLSNSYITAMQIVEADPAFKDAVKYDESVADVVWDRSKYPTIDDLKNAILRRFAQYGVNLSKATRDDIVTTLSNDPARRINTVRSFMEDLCARHVDASEKDLDTLMEHLHVEDFETPDVVANGLPHKGMYKKAFDLFFRKAAMRLYTAYSSSPITNDVVLVFVGSQGIGKTRLCKYMAMTEAKYVDLGNKSAAFGSPDWVRHIMGMFIAELGEMHVMRKSEVETIKSGISEVFDSLTPKFKEGVKKVPRTVSFLGTSNEIEFLRDLSGNRRFFPIALRSVDHEFLFDHPEIVERIWAYYYGMVKGIMCDWDSAGKLMPFANKPPSWMMRPSDDLAAYYKIVNEESTDIGIVGDMIRDAITKVEAESIHQSSRKVLITLQDLIVKVYGVGNESMARDDFKKKAKWLLEKFGYVMDRGTDRFGIKGRAYVINKTSPMYKSRINGSASVRSDF